eukprot:NODE_186_length_15678_cov_0.309262.p11 type:complete len:109 gc:universal NODE_186_length_15678_cov_0.309262:9268-9594(+)
MFSPYETMEIFVYKRNVSTNFKVQLKAGSGIGDLKREIAKQEEARLSMPSVYKERDGGVELDSKMKLAFTDYYDIISSGNNDAPTTTNIGKGNSTTGYQLLPHLWYQR